MKNAFKRTLKVSTLKSYGEKTVEMRQMPQNTRFIPKPGMAEKTRKALKGILISTRGELALGAIVLIAIGAFSLIQWATGRVADARDSRRHPHYQELVKQ